jgi:enamine deaminase RidA (YjgF/YER057c/UK114 family)
MGERRSIDVEGLQHKGPLPNASRIGPFVATGNIYGRDPATRAIPSDPEEQVRCMFENLRLILAAAGAGLEDVLRIEFTVATLEVRPLVNRHWVEAFPDPASRPARSVVTYDGLGAPAVIRCDALAVIGD